MKRYLFLVPFFTLTAFAQENLEVIQVEGSYEAPTWQEQDKTKILTGKKNRTSKINYLPPLQTDNARQVFAQQPSIYTPQLSTEPWASMNYRGIGDPHEAKSLLILQDGLPTAIDIYGAADNYFTPPAPLMDEVQVIAGGGALLYGPSATGTINFRTPPLEKGMETHGRLNVAGGSYNLLSTVNTVTGSTGNTSYYAGYHRKQGDGYQRNNADFFADYLQLKTHTYLENNSLLKFSLQGYDSDFGMPGGMALESGPGINTWSRDNRTSTKSNDRNRVSRGLMSVGLEKKLSSSTTLDATLWGVAYRRYSKIQTPATDPFGRFPTANTNAITNVHAYSFNGEARVGHQWEKWDNKHQLNVGYTSYNTNSPTFTERGTARSNHGAINTRNTRTTRVQAVYAENKFTLGRFSLVPGVRYENISLSNENFTKASNITLKNSETYNVILGGLGASYFLSDSTQAYTNVSQGFTPVGYNDVLAQSNPAITVQGNIDPGYTYSYEAGVRGETEKINWDTSLYLIHRQNIVATSNNVLTNGRSVQYRGLEGSITWKNFLNLQSSHELDVYLNGNFNNAKYHGGQFEGKTPAYVPSVLLKYGLIYRIEQKLKASLLGTFVNEHYADDGHTSRFKVPSYSIYDLLFEYSLNRHWSLNGAVNNLLDEAYYTRVQATGILPTMGRNMYAGVNYRF